MTKKVTRNSTKFAFNIGYVLIIYSLCAVTYGLISGLVTDANFVAVILAILGTGAAFFGINNARVATENITATKYTAVVAASSPFMPESTELTSSAGTVTVEQKPQIENMGQQADLPVGDYSR